MDASHLVFSWAPCAEEKTNSWRSGELFRALPCVRILVALLSVALGLACVYGLRQVNQWSQCGGKHYAFLDRRQTKLSLLWGNERGERGSRYWGLLGGARSLRECV